MNEFKNSREGGKEGRKELDLLAGQRGGEVVDAVGASAEASLLLGGGVHGRERAEEGVEAGGLVGSRQSVAVEGVIFISASLS